MVTLFRYVCDFLIIYTKTSRVPDVTRYAKVRGTVVWNMPQSEGEPNPPSSAPSARLSSGTPLRSLARRDLLYMITKAKRARATRTLSNVRHNQSLITVHFPDLRPASLPIHHRLPALTPLLQRSLPSLGWKLDPSYMIQFDPPQ